MRPLTQLWPVAAGSAIAVLGLGGLGLFLLASYAPLRPSQATPPAPPRPRPGVSLTPPSLATADSNDQMIAVTGIDLTGSSILYVIDTENRQLAVYQANGGSDSTQSVKLVGARRIDLDLRLWGYNDESKYSFEQLEERFRESAETPPK